jgi:hypothetical protein
MSSALPPADQWAHTPLNHLLESLRTAHQQATQLADYEAALTVYSRRRGATYRQLAQARTGHSTRGAYQAVYQLLRRYGGGQPIPTDLTRPQ